MPPTTDPILQILDAAPTSGCKSFMINGRGEDLFFCEVNANDRYKIKAALGGRLPFKYIAEGAF